MIEGPGAGQLVRIMAQEQTRPMDETFLNEIAELIEQQEKVIARLDEMLKYY